MTITDYLINIALVALVILQIRGSRLDLKNALRPVVIVAVAAVYYLRGFPTAGNDLLLDLVLGGIGLALGIACGATTRVWRAGDGFTYAKAGVIAAALWMIVKTHVNRVFAKIAVQSRAQAVRYAISNGLARPGAGPPGIGARDY